MIYDHLYQGGIFFMLPIFVLWIMALGLILHTLIYLNMSSTKIYLKMQKDLVFFTGSFAFLLGILGHITALIEAHHTLLTLENVSQEFILEGLAVSLLPPLYGFILFIITILFWFEIRLFIRK